MEDVEATINFAFSPFIRSFFPLDENGIFSHSLSLFKNWLLRPYFKFSLIVSLNIFVSIDLFSLKEILVMEKKCLVCWGLLSVIFSEFLTLVFPLFCSVVSILYSNALTVFLAMSLLLLLLLMHHFPNGYGFLFHFFPELSGTFLFLFTVHHFCFESTGQLSS